MGNERNVKMQNEDKGMESRLGERQRGNVLIKSFSLILLCFGQSPIQQHYIPAVLPVGLNLRSFFLQITSPEGFLI